jgi:aminoglycoside phosphotransferase family enzyme
MGGDDQQKIFKAMMDPAFYPHKVDGPFVWDTHISKIFLTGQYVYKIKKKVDLGFVNFLTVDQRRHFCEKEIILNRRLTDDVYIGVIPLCFDGQAFAMNGPGKTVEYAVQMRQLPHHQTMEALLKNSLLTHKMIKHLAVKLSDFHQHASRSHSPEVWSYAQAACMENLRIIKPFVGDLLDRSWFDSVHTATFNFFIRNKPLFEKRLKEGRFRDVHGDLRTEHVYMMANDQIQILDCIEFNQNLRQVDTASDLAFLIMDLEFHHQPDIARQLLNIYCQRDDDDSLFFLLDFYKCYRAMVRCKVNCLIIENTDIDKSKRDKFAEDARQYLYLAHEYARRFDRPILWVFCGVPASGKSTLASKLARILSIEVHNSDRLRKTLHGIDVFTCSSEPTDQGLYAPEVKEKVYAYLFELARKAIREGRSVILDAAFSAPTHRIVAVHVFFLLNAKHRTKSSFNA